MISLKAFNALKIEFRNKRESVLGAFLNGQCASNIVHQYNI